MKKSFKSDRPKRHYTYNDIFKKANLIIQISSSIFMLLATLGFMFGIVGITLGVVNNTTNIKLNTVSGISLLVISSYVFLMCAISLCLSVISNYYKTTIYLEILAIFSIVSIVCMIGGFLIIFSGYKYQEQQTNIQQTNNQQVVRSDQQVENKTQTRDQTNSQILEQNQIDTNQNTVNQTNINQNTSDQLSDNHIINTSKSFNQNEQALLQAKRNEKYHQVKRTYQLVKENKLSEEKLHTIFNSDPEFKKMYEEFKKKSN
ncbi:YIP1 family protein [Mycoplasma feriruminatoris]|uniref:YIP1 family protein n=1 Tax=Mycoplasma feriruminatoris TaxID=1179777 RepID=A0ABY8HWD1_9MOLU|nr:YIP1 family protein [Mycoplasma feriruminatoris]WFQ93301.1 YIP1 family protein [Mycoplasma feriruminatoris]